MENSTRGDAIRHARVVGKEAKGEAIRWVRSIDDKEVTTARANKLRQQADKILPEGTRYEIRRMIPTVGRWGISIELGVAWYTPSDRFVNEENWQDSTDLEFPGKHLPDLGLFLMGKFTSHRSPTE